MSFLLNHSRALSQGWICRPLQKWPYLHESCPHWWIEWKIIFPIISFWDMVVKDVTIRQQKKSFKSGQIYREDANWSDNDFLSMSFFFVRLLVFEIWSILYMADCIIVRPVRCAWGGGPCDTQHLKEILRNMPLTLTSEARVFNPRAC